MARKNRDQNVADNEARGLEKAAAYAEVRRAAAVGQALDLKAALDAVRGGPLDVKAAAAMAQGDLTRMSMVFWTRCMSVLADRAENAPDIASQISAADKGAQRAAEMARLIAEAQGRVGTQPVVAAATPADDGLTREEKIAILRAQMRVAR